MIGRDGEWIAYHTNSYMFCGVEHPLGEEVNKRRGPTKRCSMLNGKTARFLWTPTPTRFSSVLAKLGEERRAVNYLKRLAAQNPWSNGATTNGCSSPRLEKYPSLMAYASGDYQGGAKGAPMGGSRSTRSWCR